MTDRAALRQRLLDAFGVTEDDLAALDNGYAAARAEAEADRDRFLAYIERRAQEISEEITRVLLSYKR